MSPASTATPKQDGSRATPVLPFPHLPLPLDLRLGWDREIVVDWQMPSDSSERKN